MVEVFKGNLISIIVSEFGFSDGGTFDISAEVSHDGLVVIRRSSAMNDPSFFVKLIEEVVEGKGVVELL